MHEEIDHVLLRALVLVPQQALTILTVFFQKQKPSAIAKQLRKREGQANRK